MAHRRGPRRGGGVQRVLAAL